MPALTKLKKNLLTTPFPSIDDIFDAVRYGKTLTFRYLVGRQTYEIQVYMTGIDRPPSDETGWRIRGDRDHFGTSVIYICKYDPSHQQGFITGNVFI